MKDAELSREELEELVAHLREENARLRDEIRRLARERHEFPALPVKPSRIARTVPRYDTQVPTK